MYNVCSTDRCLLSHCDVLFFNVVYVYPLHRFSPHSFTSPLQTESHLLPAVHGGYNQTQSHLTSNIHSTYVRRDLHQCFSSFLLWQMETRKQIIHLSWGWNFVLNKTCNEKNIKCHHNIHVWYSAFVFIFYFTFSAPSASHHDISY